MRGCRLSRLPVRGPSRTLLRRNGNSIRFRPTVTVRKAPLPVRVLCRFRFYDRTRARCLGGSWILDEARYLRQISDIINLFFSIPSFIYARFVFREENMFLSLLVSLQKQGRALCPTLKSLRSPLVLPPFFFTDA